MTRFTLVNHDSQSVFVEDSRGDAQERKERGINEFGFAESDLDVVPGEFESYEAYQAADTDSDGWEAQPSEPNDGNTQVVNSPEPSDPGGPSAEELQRAQESAEVAPEPPTEELPEERPGVDTDPLTWMPADFTDKIDGSVAINRKGYEVMAHHYGVGTTSTCEVGPEETGFEFCRVHATATTDDGVTYEAHGSAHVDRGDDKELLLEMADTRARKRAVAQATGVGMVAVSELQNDLNQ